MNEPIPQPYPLFLAEITVSNKVRFGRIIYWREDRPNVLFTKVNGQAQEIHEVYIDEKSTRAWIGDSISELKAHLHQLRAKQ
jgi:hypothetical protein